MPRYPHVIFDLDHTLWDFERNSRAALAELYTEFALGVADETPFEVFFKRYQRHNNNCWQLYRKGNMDKETLRVERFRRAFVDIGEDRLDLIPDLADAYLDRAPRQPHLFEGAVEMLTSLQDCGVALHLLTNGFEEVQVIKLACSGLDRFFDKFYSPETLGVKKPHPNAFTTVMDAHWARPEECLMVGDDLQVDVLGAQKVGIHGVYFNPKAIPHKSKPRYEVQHLQELLPIVLNP